MKNLLTVIMTLALATSAYAATEEAGTAPTTETTPKETVKEVENKE